MKKNRIKFSEDGTEFQIIFKNDSETIYFSSKEEGFKTVKDLLQKKKITAEDFSEMRDQILEAEKLSWSDSENSFQFQIGFFGFLNTVLGDRFGMSDILAAPEEPVKFTYLKMCSRCNGHGRIYTKAGYTSNLDTKTDAIKCLEELKKRKKINNEEFEKVKKEIEESNLVN